MAGMLQSILTKDIKSSGFIESLITLWPLTSGFRPRLAIMVTLGFLASLVESVAISLVTFLVYTAITGGVNAPEKAGTSLPQQVLHDTTSILNGNVALVCALIAATVLVRAVLSSLYSVLTAQVRNKMHDRVRRSLFDQYLSLSYSYMATRTAGDLTNALQVEAWRVAEFVEHCARIVINTCAIVVFSGILLVLSWQVLLAAVICGLLFLSAVQLSRRKLQELGSKATAANEALADKIVASVGSLRTIKALGLEESVSGTFTSLSHEVRNLLIRVSALDSAFRPVFDLLLLLMVGAVVWLSHHLGDSAPRTLTLVALIYRLQPHVRELQGHLMAVFSLEAALSTVVNDLMADGRPYPPNGKRAFAGLQREITFENVSFQHPGMNNQSLSQATFHISRGSTFALLGGSGAGKTTVANLLLKLYEPTSGIIRIDGVPLCEIERRSWLSRVAITGQDIELLEGSLLDNLCLAKPKASPPQVWRALEIAGIRDFTETLPNGLDTRVGQRGFRLSGGQRQRISLARALVAEPNILILDEATNAVESILERRVQRDIRDAFPSMTIILIAHRSSALELIDSSIRLEAGHSVLATSATAH
ncbi:ABC transporter ATP-binding protein [Microvirga aerilata]|uniref:ABC transporter ATP-binding protein n=1 Tax=Microvirga aerilata TaxID=670292 RepID=A0A936ZLG8_9HYPH|nr:ABC transporter ATP-binding protein [Microvirga aerilata]MBL0408245.1 ABC transporter ATP-binding protein [Microvirga aerilata]